MTEKQNLLSDSPPNKFSSEARAWVSSFGLRVPFPKLSFLHEDKAMLQKDMLKRRISQNEKIDEKSETPRASYQALPERERIPSSNLTFIKDLAVKALAGAPALVIAVLLNLFFGVSFGQAFFPTSWVFPPGVPRAIGVQVISTRVKLRSLRGKLTALETI
jgi:hypothetical protein